MLWWDSVLILLLGFWAVQILRANLRQTAMIRELLIRNHARSGQIRAELTAIRQAVSPKLGLYEGYGPGKQNTRRLRSGV
jgi:hypothetical protein